MPSSPAGAGSREETRMDYSGLSYDTDPEDDGALIQHLKLERYKLEAQLRDVTAERERLAGALLAAATEMDLASHHFAHSSWLRAAADKARAALAPTPPTAPAERTDARS